MTRLECFAATGATATFLAAACSLPVDGVAAKHWTWAVVGLVVSVAAGVWAAWREAP